MGLRSAAPASPVISAGVARAAAPGPLPLARAPSQTPVTAYWRRLLACVLTRLLVRNDEFAVLLDRGVAAGGAAAAAPGPARTPPAGFRRTGQDRQRGVKSAKAPPDTGGGEPTRTKPPFPRQPEVGHRVAGIFFLMIRRPPRSTLFPQHDGA